MIALSRSDASATADLRRRVLRPGSTGPIPGDGEPTGVLFLAAHDDGVLVATGNVRREPAPGAAAGSGGTHWRLRGMATEPARRGQGHGAAVLAALVVHCRAAGGTLLWANARLPALGFYRRAGFTIVGEPWTDPEIGPHVVITLAL